MFEQHQRISIVIYIAMFMDGIGTAWLSVLMQYEHRPYGEVAIFLAGMTMLAGLCLIGNVMDKREDRYRQELLSNAFSEAHRKVDAFV